MSAGIGHAWSPPPEILPIRRSDGGAAGRTELVVVPRSGPDLDGQPDQESTDESIHEPSHKSTHDGIVQEKWRDTFDRALPWTPPGMPIVVVVPHPDDEVLMAGALIRLQRDRHVSVRIVAVTDGEAAYDENGRDEDARLLLRRRRRREQLAALEVLGVGRSHVDRLELPDGAVADHVPELAAWIGREYPDHAVVAPWIADGHPDHEACGRAARIATDQSGSPLWYGFFWLWHRALQDSLADVRLRRLDVSRSVALQRRVAMACHQSQLVRTDGEPILTRSLLEPVRWSAEYYLEASAIGKQQPRDTTRFVAVQDAS